MIGQFAVLVVSIDAPLRMLLDNEQSKEFVPSALLKQNKYGAYTNGIKLVIDIIRKYYSYPVICTGGSSCSCTAYKTEFCMYASSLFVGIRSISCTS